MNLRSAPQKCDGLLFLSTNAVSGEAARNSYPGETQPRDNLVAAALI
jgi:hypothetical protein